MTSRPPDLSIQLAAALKLLKLPGFLRHYNDLAKEAEKGGWSFPQYLWALTELEARERDDRRVERHLRQSGLPAEKTLATLKLERLPTKVRRILPSLCEGGFVDRGDNVLAFGLPGRGKSHLSCAIGHELVRKGYSVWFTPTSFLVQRLLAAKRDLVLERELRRLDKIDVVIVDDLGYVQQDRTEMEVLFTFLAERYERKSVMITSNLVFSQWDRIFKDSMTTAAAIDRLVHHCTILELTGKSVRADEAGLDVPPAPPEPSERPPA